jgi:hypothetical protein
MIWYPPQIYDGATVAVIGGGPSVNAEQVRAVRTSGLRTIGVNDSYKFGVDIDLCFWGDHEWYFGNERHPGHRDSLSKFHGLKVTCAPNCAEMPGVHYLSPMQVAGLWPAPCCKWYRNSGLTVIGMAIPLGAKRIVLLGFEGGASAGQTHWHPDLVNVPDETIFKQHVASAHELLKDVEQWPGGKSVEIWNASPFSNYPFPQVTLCEFLGGLK